MCIHPHICICNSCMIFMHTHTYGGMHTYMYHVYTSIHVYLIFMCGMTVYTHLSWISFMIYIHPYKFMWCSSVIFLYTPTYYCIDFCNYHVETSIHIYHVYATIHVYLISCICNNTCIFDLHVWCECIHTPIVVFNSAQGWNNRTLAVHERVDSRFLVLPGSESTITEITEYTYFSPLRPCRAFIYKSE